jgi:hypothetical protein
MKNAPEMEIIIDETEEPVDIEASVEPEQKPSRTQRYRIRVDSQYYIIEVPATLRGKQTRPRFAQPPRSSPIFTIPGKKSHNALASRVKTTIRRVYSWLING